MTEPNRTTANTTAAVETLDEAIGGAVRHLVAEAEAAGLPGLAAGVVDLRIAWKRGYIRFLAGHAPDDPPGIHVGLERLAALRRKARETNDPADARAACSACSALQTARAKLCPVLGCDFSRAGVPVAGARSPGHDVARCHGGTAPACGTGPNPGTGETTP